MAAVLLTGCGSTETGEGGALQEMGVLTLSVNPEIRIEYNQEGKVTGLTGQNDDGEGIVASYQDYIGKNCDVVLQDLIAQINAAAILSTISMGIKRILSCSWNPARFFPVKRSWPI